jgi:uncharacterized protein (DUF1697 family)
VTRRAESPAAPLYVAFLRAINVGGRTVRMDRLREIFKTLGFADVDTFIASGNVVFRSNCADLALLERRIEEALEAGLGYKVAAFIRRVRDLEAIVRHQPFARDGDAAPGTVYVAFLRAAITATVRQKIRACRTEVDELDIKGRELYWCVRGKLLDSKLSGAGLERLLGQTTMRNRNTIVRLAAKYAERG